MYVLIENDTPYHQLVQVVLLVTSPIRCLIIAILYTCTVVITRVRVYLKIRVGPIPVERKGLGVQSTRQRVK